MQKKTSRPHGQASASASAEEVPDTSSGPMLVELACEKCQRVTIPGQFVCLECGQRLKAGHRANIRAKAREDRSKHANRIADKLGVAISSLTSQHILFHTEEGDSSGRGKRGMQSFDAEAIATARKHRQRALKKQEGGRHFTSVSDRFTRDSQFALRLLENGVDRERALQLDYLCNAKLPAPPRSREQIIGGLGSLSEVGPHRGDDKMNTAARLCFLSDEPEDLVKAGLIDPRMPPICIAWLGAFMPVTKFAKVWSANRKTVQYLLTFSKGTRSIEDVRDEQDMIEKLSDEVKNELPAAAKAAQDAARDAERSRAAQPKYESQTPPPKAKGEPKGKGKGKAQTQSKGSGKDRRPRGQAYSSHYQGGWYSGSSSSSGYQGWRHGKGW